jgi:hypothetical protein
MADNRATFCPLSLEQALKSYLWMRELIAYSVIPKKNYSRGCENY